MLKSPMVAHWKGETEASLFRTMIEMMRVTNAEAVATIAERFWFFFRPKWMAAAEASGRARRSQGKFILLK